MLINKLKHVLFILHEALHISREVNFFFFNKKIHELKQMKVSSNR